MEIVEQVDWGRRCVLNHFDNVRPPTSKCQESSVTDTRKLDTIADQLVAFHSLSEAVEALHLLTRSRGISENILLLTIIVVKLQRNLSLWGRCPYHVRFNRLSVLKMKFL